MLSLMLQRIALRGPLTLSRVGLSSVLSTQRASRTFVTSQVRWEPARSKVTEDGEEVATPKRKRTVKTAATTKKTTTAKKTTAKKDAKPKKVKKAAAKPPKISIKGHEPPKRPPTAWMLFVGERKAATGTTFGSVADANAFMKESSEAWKGLSDGQKQKYADEAAAKLIEYATRREEYLKTVPRDVLKEINRRLAKGGHRKYKVRAAFERPQTSYLRFAKDYRPEFDRTYTGTPKEYAVALARASGERWRNLSSTEKEPYVTAYRRELEEFNAQKKAAVDAS
ncbi:hypothetical protein BC629DRAFT_1632476 [Irpex lacteus]|nr:hypothetical protein BC629DRAFT_1632476 [Irpex lacteus]